jgi:hypothetical protein
LEDNSFTACVHASCIDAHCQQLPLFFLISLGLLGPLLSVPVSDPGFEFNTVGDSVQTLSPLVPGLYLLRGLCGPVNWYGLIGHGLPVSPCLLTRKDRQFSKPGRAVLDLNLKLRKGASLQERLQKGEARKLCCRQWKSVRNTVRSHGGSPSPFIVDASAYLGETSGHHFKYYGTYNDP